MNRNIKYYILIAASILILVIVSLMLGMTYNQNNLIRMRTENEAQILFDSIVITRRWNARHGGVYVLKGPGEQSNPYLKNSDITTKDGKVYTLKNPALMTREISFYSGKDIGFTFHITSLKLKNPNNRPDPWEEKALKLFEKGLTKVTEVTQHVDSYFFRLMRPLMVEKACLVCHEDQGYKVGDIRGGISVTLPYDQIFKALKKNTLSMIAMTIILIIVLCLILYFFVWRLLEKLTMQNEELAFLNETKDRFFGIAAHDLRNPLSAVLGFSDLLANSLPDGMEKMLSQRIQINSEKMLSMVSSFLDISKIKSGKLDLESTENNLFDFLSECREENKFLAEKKGMSLELDLNDKSLSGFFDRNRMAQAVDNLVSNAIKFSSKGDSIIIGAAKAQDLLQIWVKDNGPGIPTKDIPILFNEFTRATNRPTAGEESHGLGLAIVKRLVELHHGKIEVASEMGEGSRFIISIPDTGRMK
jgi:signal transduction histidine kinase